METEISKRAVRCLESGIWLILFSGLFFFDYYFSSPSFECSVLVMAILFGLCGGIIMSRKLYNLKDKSLPFSVDWNIYTAASLVLFFTVMFLMASYNINLIYLLGFYVAGVSTHLFYCLAAEKKYGIKVYARFGVIYFVPKE